jgi:hypothetical protein
MQQHTFRQTFRRLGVSPNVVWTIVPAVSTPLENAVFALYSGKKPASAQKNSLYYRFAGNHFKFAFKTALSLAENRFWDRPSMGFCIDWL